MAVRRPGIEVVQQFQQAAAALNLPTLPALIVGPGFEIADAVNSGTYTEGLSAPIEFPFTVATAGAIVDLSEPPTAVPEANAHKPVGVSISNALLVKKSTATVGVAVAGSTTFNDPTVGAFSGFDPDAVGAPTFFVDVISGTGLDPADIKRHFVISKTDDNNLVVAGEFIGAATDINYRVLEDRTLEVVAVADFATRGITKSATGVSVNPGFVSNDGLVVAEADILLSWRALRPDLAGGLTVFTDIDSIEAVFGIGSVVAGNPGAFAINLALQNTTTEVNFTGLTGTFFTNEENAFTDAFSFIEDKDVYGISVLTHNTTVHQNIKAHVEGFSASTVGRERVAFINRKLASTAVEVPASGIGSVISAGVGNGTSDSGIINNGKFRDPTNGQFITDKVGVGFFLEISAYTAVSGVQRSVTPDEADYMEDASGPPSTFRLGKASFVAGDVGKILSVQGATTSANDIEFTIDAFINANKITSAVVIPTDELLAAGTRTWITTLDRAPAVLGTDSLVAATKTWIFGNGAFTSADVGRLVHITGTNLGNNDGFFVIAQVTDATTIVTEAVATTAVDESFAGTETLRILSVDREVLRDLTNDSVNGTNRNWTILGANFNSSDVGRVLRIAGAFNAGNNADHTIVEVISASVVRTSTATTPVTESFIGFTTGSNGVITTLDVVSVAPSTTEDSFIKDTRHTISAINSESEILLAADPTNGFGGTIDSVTYTITRDLTKDEEADFIAGYTASFASRRVVHTWPDILAISVNGASIKVPGYFAGAAYAGLTAGLPSQAGFTNLGITGFIGREDSDDRFSDTQLDKISGGGSMILIQEVPGAPLITRHQLTTDTSTIFFQEFSVTKNVDLLSRFFRNLFAPFIGIYNITDTLLDILKTRGESGITFLLAARVQRVGAPIRRGTLASISESEIQPDSVEITVDVDVPLPLNNLKITLLV